MLTERFEQALTFATQVHAKQKRKGTDIPYVSHLLAVCSLVLEHGGKEDEAIAALLHETVEDQGGPAVYRKIVEQFGQKVADIVLGCTDSDQTPKPPWTQRKKAYIEQIAHAPPAVRPVSASDKLHNIRCILADFRRHGPEAFKKFVKGMHGTVWYYRTLSDAFLAAKPPAAPHLLEELERNVHELERLTGINGREVDFSKL